MLEDLARPQSKAVYCKVEMQLSELEPNDRDILIGALADLRAWPASTLSTQLRLKGLSLADVTITKHRTQACACYRG